MKNNFVTQRKRLGEILVRRGTITPEELAGSLRVQKGNSAPLGQILKEQGVLNEEELAQALGEQLGIPHVWLRQGLVDPGIVRLLPKEKAVLYQVIPMFKVQDVLTVATADPHAIFVLDEVSKITKLRVQPVLCRADDIMEAISEYYRKDISVDDILASAGDTELELVERAQEREISEIAELAGHSPVINLTNMILLRAIRDGASDIHLEPHPDRFRVRVRIDGVLYELMSPKLEMHPAVVSRLKVMANLDIAERRLPQDGRVQVMVENRRVDLRFSSMPGIHGEKVVLRILDRSQSILDVNILGFEPDTLARFKSFLRRPNGLILVCGPTGSGKTTTLYAGLTMLNTSENNIITVEDPVEYHLDGVNQNQVREGIGLTFARFLKHALRQDPDVMMVGEIRDRETAEIAIQASLTGHLVLSTLHTNDAPSAITRLLEMGVAPFLISSALIAVLSQRLIRLICPSCKVEYLAPQAVLEALGQAETKTLRLSRGRGCASCYDSGFKGRTSIFELLEVDEDLQRLVLQNLSIDSLRQQLRSKGFLTLKSSGYRKVLQGVTTIEEVNRVTVLED